MLYVICGSGTKVCVLLAISVAYMDDASSVDMYQQISNRHEEPFIVHIFFSYNVSLETFTSVHFAPWRYRLIVIFANRMNICVPYDISCPLWYIIIHMCELCGLYS